MFKDVFVLKKTSWHMKMMKYIWGFDHRDFSHMCPYWWLSVLNVIIFIPYFAIREFFRYVGKFFTWLFQMFEAAGDAIKHYQNERLERILDRLVQEPEVITKILEKGGAAAKKLREKFSYHGSDKARRAFRQIDNELDETKERKAREAREAARQRTLDVAPVVESELIPTDLFAIDKAAEIARRIREEEERKRRIRNRERIARLVKGIKPVLTTLAYTAGSIVVGIAVFYFGKLCLAIWSGLSKLPHIKWVEIGHTAGWIGLWAAGIVCGVLFLLFIIRVLSKIRITLPAIGPKTSYTLRAVGSVIWWPFRKLGQAFVWAINGLVSGVGFLIQMFKNNCPALKWED